MTYYVGTDINAAGGNVLVSGQYVVNKPPYLTGGFLMKCNDTGTVQWTRLYDSIGHSAYSYFNYYRLLQLSDGSIMMAGGTNNEKSGNNDLVLTHIDNAGNIIWSKTYASRIWQGFNGSGDYFFVQQMQQDPASGDIFFTGPHWANGKNVTRVKIADGSLAWSKYYDLYGADFDRPFGLDIRSNDLVVFSRHIGYYGGNYTSMFRINKNTGDTISTKYLKTVDPSNFNLGFLGTEDVVKLNNGNYAIGGEMYRYYYALNDSVSPLYHAGVAEINSNLDFVKGYCFSNRTESNFYNTRITVFKDGSGVFSMLRYISGYAGDVYYIQFKDGQIVKQRKRSYFNEGMPNENHALKLTDRSDLMVKLLGDPVTNINKIEFLNLHISDTSSACLGVDDNTTVTKPFSMVPVTWAFDSVGVNDFSESINKTITVGTTLADNTPACRQVSYCDTLSLIPSADTICISAPFIMKFRKNPACGANLFLQYDTSNVQSYQQLNDSSYQFNFKAKGSTVIYGSILGCALIKDSVNIVVLNSPGNINLGNDTVICPGNTIHLSAKPGYVSYLWQNGSTDSVLQVQQPGIYYVVATDACGNIFRDTISIAPHAPIPFDLGPDINICEKDTINIIAPFAFSNYQWSPNYRINNLVSQSVKVYPLIDTMYHIRAEKTPGCFVTDSIHVHVNHAPAIDLGTDKSFCTGDSLVLNAGVAGISNYTWSTGTTGQYLTVYKSGNYSVMGITAEGCKSKDTLVVLNVFVNPKVDLGSDNTLCAGGFRSLDAGNFDQYLWNNGSIDRSITVDQTGLYSVMVTDKNNCKGYDSITINKIIPLPGGFLPADTSICTYGKLSLKPAGDFDTYLWSTNESSPAITVNTAGIYWLEVKDAYNCRGRDSIVVTAKDCMFGFYIPNAFTPGHDGKNNIFRPLIFGNLLRYEFIIYNRWGQLIFRTTELRKGWDGGYTTQSSQQITNTFVWVCTYQLENEPVKIEKGTVLLIK